MKFFLLALLLFSGRTFAQAKTDEISSAVENIFSADSDNKFSYYQPNYFIFGHTDLKLQFSGKYRISRAHNLYFAMTQVMFWSIYAESKPFKEINYSPEVFYRLLETNHPFIRSIDMGYLHTSNGRSNSESRSIERVFLKQNFEFRLEGDRRVVGDLKAFHIFNEDKPNKTIRNYMGFWEYQMFVTNIWAYEKQRLDFEFRIFAGSKVVNFDKGGRTLGLVYHLGSDEFNPSLYAQYYAGYAENLRNFNRQTEQFRFGLLLFL